MSKTALSEQNYDLIKAHIHDPDHSPLNPEHQYMFDRIVSIAKVLDKTPVMKHAVDKHLAKYNDITKQQAYVDGRMAVKLFNTLHSFDYDFWQTWLINDIVRNIENCRNRDSHQDRRVIAMEHANLIKAIGEKPVDLPDPTRNEKHQFYLLVQINNQNVKIDINNLQKLPEDTLRELNRALSAGNEITIEDAKKIMES